MKMLETIISKKPNHTLAIHATKSANVDQSYLIKIVVSKIFKKRIKINSRHTDIVLRMLHWFSIHFLFNPDLK